MTGRGLRAASTVLIVAGVLLVADAVLTVVWQEPVSAVTAHVEQRSLGEEVRALERAAPTPTAQRALRHLAGDRRRMAYLAEELRGRAARGSAIGRIAIPAIGVRRALVAGSDLDTLGRGPGLYDGAPLPGMAGTVAVAGHRTTHGAPFRRLDDLRRDDVVSLVMPYGVFVYRVEHVRVVDPEEVSVIAPADHERVVLTACHPLHSAARRIVVTARLDRARARGTAAGAPRPVLPGPGEAPALDGRPLPPLGNRPLVLPGS